jgi:hypothetical protein
MASALEPIMRTSAADYPEQWSGLLHSFRIGCGISALSARQTVASDGDVTSPTLRPQSFPIGGCARRSGTMSPDFEPWRTLSLRCRSDPS